MADDPIGAGIILRAPGGELLFLQRAATSDNPGTWCWPGGTPEPGEGADETALRETEEETGYAHEGELTQVDDHMGFATFLVDVPAMFDPTLNDEHTDFTWAKQLESPEPLHPGVEGTLAMPLRALPAMDVEMLAFDRDSVRTYDRDKRLHVSVSNISKANVCPYLGREIPGHQQLGLDPNHIYQLLRCPEELARPETVASFNNLPILSEHVPVNADAHKPELVIGSTGTDATFNDPYMQNSMVFWAAQAIRDIEKDLIKELSSAYYYKADMTPGVYLGVPYDGVMRDIVANHVAKVKDGRAGDDVVVGDSKENVMTKTVLTRKAAMVQGALYATLRPLLAQDAQIDLGPALKGVGPKNYKARKAGILASVTKAVEGKLAQDASLDDVHGLLDSLDDVQPAEDTEDDLPKAGEPVDAAADDDPSSKVTSFLTDKISADDLNQVKSMLSPPAAQDEEDPDAEKDKPAEDEDEDADKDKPAEDEEDDKEMVSKTAMDAALSKMASDTAARITKQQRELRNAEAAVRPYVGELVAMDSADAVYGAALKAMGVDIAGIHTSAFPAILKMQPLPGQKIAKSSVIAMDSKSVASFNERFPEAAAIKTL